MAQWAAVKTKRASIKVPVHPLSIRPTAEYGNSEESISTRSSLPNTFLSFDPCCTNPQADMEATAIVTAFTHQHLQAVVAIGYAVKEGIKLVAVIVVSEIKRWNFSVI